VVQPQGPCRAHRIHPVLEVGDDGLEQGRVSPQDAHQLLHLGLDALGRRLADDERGEVEVVEVQQSPVAILRQALDRDLRVAQRVADRLGRPRRAADAHDDARLALHKRLDRRAHEAVVALHERDRGARAPARQVGQAVAGEPVLEAPAGFAEVEAARAVRRVVAAHEHDPRRLHIVDAHRGGARAQRGRLAAGERPEQLLEQRAAHRALLLARNPAEAGQRGEHRGGGTGRGSRQAGDPAPTPARERQPLRRALARGDRERERMPAVDLELHQRSGLVDDPLPDGRRRGLAAARRLERAVGCEQQHRRVDERRQAVDDRALWIVLAESVQEVQLHRRQTLQRSQVAVRQRAVDDADQLPERDRQRDREHRELAGLRLPQERGGHALEHDVQTEAERGGIGRLQLADQPALAGCVVAQAHARGEHDPVGLQPRRRAVDLDRVGARQATAKGVVAPGQQLQPQVLLGQQVTQRERGLRSRQRPRAESSRRPRPQPPARGRACEIRVSAQAAGCPA
jgi:hypothetical protein